MKYKKYFYPAHISFWLAYLSVSVFVFSNFFSFKDSLINSLSNVIPLILLAYLTIWNIHLFQKKKNLIKFIIYLFLLFFGFTILRYYINIILVNTLQIHVTSGKKVVLIGIFLTNILVVIFSSLYKMLEIKLRKERKQLQEIKAHQDAQIKYLRWQINPHFLFNSLNNIYALSLQNSIKTPDSILNLSSILRYILYSEAKITLNEEIKLISHYLELFFLKFKNKPNVNFNVSGNTDILQIEPMILLPLVENCFKHSDIENNIKAKIELELTITDDFLEFKTYNTKKRNKKNMETGGIGLKNIQERLALTYGLDYNFESIDKKSIFITRLTINRNAL